MLPPSTSAVADLVEYLKGQSKDSLAYTSYNDPAISERIVFKREKKNGPLSPALRQRILYRLNKYGFVIVKMPSSDEQALLQLAQTLSLGAPYVPAYYQHFGADIKVTKGVNTLMMVQGRATTTHRAFSTNQAQALHVDGTVQPIGHIQTSIVLCHMPAITGGLSTLFNTTAAVREMAERTPQLLAPLMNNAALLRAVDTAPDHPCKGPVIKKQGGDLYMRFSMDKTSDWQPGFQSVPGLRDAFHALASKVHPDSGFYHETRLQTGEALILANARISHGRTEYTDLPFQTRKMLRALFTSFPS